MDKHEGMDELKENGAIKREFIMPLLLYFLEKEYNFSGESVWVADVNPYQDLPDIPAGNIKSLSNYSR